MDPVVVMYSPRTRMGSRSITYHLQSYYSSSLSYLLDLICNTKFWDLVLRSLSHHQYTNFFFLDVTMSYDGTVTLIAPEVCNNQAKPIGPSKPPVSPHVERLPPFLGRAFPPCRHSSSITFVHPR
jgi:hypothetical protein